MLRINGLNRIYLGIQGENGARTIEIDMSDWMVAHPNGSVSLWHKRNGETTPTPTSATFDAETGILSWTPSETDTYVSGEGVASIRLTENGVIKKSEDIITGTSPSITGAGTPLGSDWASYIDMIEEYKEAAEDAADDAEDAKDAAEDAKDDAISAKNDAVSAKNDAISAKNAAVTAQGLAEGAQSAAEAAQSAAESAMLKYPYVHPDTGYWMVWDPEQNMFVSTGVKAQGPTGEVPDISVGTVTTLQPDQSAYVERRSGSPDTAPIFDFGIPKGDTGTAENIFGNTIEMSSSDPTKVSEAIGAKADKVVSGTENNFAALDANGNLKDSGHKHSDYLTAHQDISGKANIQTVAYKETGNTASQNIAKGSYVIWKGTLYTASAAITQGDTLSIMNLSPVTPGGVANKLKEYVDGLNSTLAGLINDKLNKICAAAEYSSSATYALGDLCLKGEVLYRCTTAITTAEAWTAAHWTSTTIAYELGLKKDRQTAVSDPSASGTTDEFIATISQNENGEITPTKKTVQDATTSVHGLMSAADKTKLNDISVSTQRYAAVAIAVSDWTLSGGVYSAEFTSAYITSSSHERIDWLKSYDDYAVTPVEGTKKSGGGGMIFTTTTIPTGTIMGVMTINDNDDGKVPVIIEDTTVSIANGGTGASNLAGAKANLEIPEVVNNLTTNDGTKALSAAQGYALNGKVTTKYASDKIIAIRRAGIVTLIINGISGNGSSVVFDTLASDYRPTNGLNAVVLAGATPSLLGIGTDGKMTMYSISTSQTWYGCVSYVAAN